MLKKLRKLKIGLKVKVVVPTIALVTFALLLNSTINQLHLRSSLIEICKEQAVIAVNAASTELHVDYIKTMAEGSEGSNIHGKLKESLKTILDIGTIEDVYCVTKDGDGYQYAFDLNETSPIGSPVDYDLKLLAKSFEGEPTVSEGIEVYEGAHIITAYKPLLDSTGKIAAVIGVDYNVDKVQDKIDSLKTRAVLRTLAFVGFNTLVIFLILTSIVRSIKRVGNKLADIAGDEGDLTNQIEVKSSDEVAVVATHLNQLLSKLSDMIRSVDTSIRIAQESSEEIHQGCVSTSDDLVSATSALGQIDATMEVIADTVKQVEESFATVMSVSEQIANDATSDANDVSLIVDKAQEAYTDAVSSKEEAIEYSRRLSNRVEMCIDEAKSVGEIKALTDTVLNIASQTHLLSLNASIEAARAGEFGRGFAVVATEMAQLAEQSASAAKQIQEISSKVIDSVTSLTQETETLIKFSEEVTDTGYNKLAALAEDYKTNVTTIKDDLTGFSKVSGSVHEDMYVVKDSIDIIVMSVDECTVAIDAINKAVNSMADASMKVREASDVNNKNISDLKDFVGSFKYNQ